MSDLFLKIIVANLMFYPFWFILPKRTRRFIEDNVNWENFYKQFELTSESKKPFMIKNGIELYPSWSLK